jgi:dimethylaniline monooxygenase (N-oxide forming)
LVSSKQLTAFSDFRLPLNAPDHLTLPAYVKYLEGYVSHFRLEQRAERFRLGTRVNHLRRNGKGGHTLTWTNKDGSQETDDFTHISLCTGLHVTPSYPEIAGLPPIREKGKNSEVQEYLSKEQASIKTLHSSSYKSPDIYKGKRVLLLGTGETGMDMAYEAVKAGAKEIVMCTRNGFLSFPAILENFQVLGFQFDRPTPIDGLITNLFETTYVHPWVSKSHLRWFVSDMIIKRVLWVLTGTQAGCNQWVGELPKDRLGRAYVFLNKSSRAMPYINRNWKQRHWLMEKFASYPDPPSVRDDEPSVDMAPFPSHVTPEGQVVFRRNNRKEYERMKDRKVFPEVVVFCTGYRQEFQFIDESKGEYPVPSQADCRDIFAKEDPTVSFIGFTRPGVGAIPPQAEMSAQLWGLIIAGKRAIPQDAGHYYLLAKENARIRYGVDYSSYVSQLARDIGSDPGLWTLWKQYGIKIVLIYCFSAAFPTHYRLTGPFYDSKAADILNTEILETITRRGIGGNLMMGIIPMAFYAWVNAMAYLLEKVVQVLQFIFPKTINRLSRSVSHSIQHQSGIVS